MSENEIQVLEPTLHISRGDVERHIGFQRYGDLVEIVIHRWALTDKPKFKGEQYHRHNKKYKGPNKEGITLATSKRFDRLLKMDFLHRPDNIVTFVTFGLNWLEATFWVDGRLGEDRC